MARVTVEDCIEHVENRFELVALAAQRAKTIASGSSITIERDNDKDSVVALREIAQQTVSTADLRNHVIQTFQRPSEVSEEGLVAQQEEMDVSKMEKAAKTEVTKVLEEESEADLLTEDAVGDDAGFSFEEENVEVDD